MSYVPLAPFRRALTLGHLAQAKAPPMPEDAPDKWQVLEILTTCRKVLGVTDRDLNVLRALLSFMPGNVLHGNMVVYPSNATLCERLNGMPCSTMRRHLAKLVERGIIARRDSPNGKRYTRYIEGEKFAFGLDLTPLLRGLPAWRELAAELRLAEQALRQLRERVSLKRRDLSALALLGAVEQPSACDWDAVQQIAIDTAMALRRVPEVSHLLELEHDLDVALDATKAVLRAVTEDLSTTDSQIEQHIQNSIMNPSDSTENMTVPEISGSADKTLSVSDVMTYCPELQSFSETEINHWSDLQTVTDQLRPMMGITSETWTKAREQFGAFDAILVLSTILQKIDHLRSPGAYLRVLTQKAAVGKYDPRQMLRRRTSGYA